MKNKELFFTNRRDFLKISGLVAGTITADLWGNVPLSMAKDIYPSQKITYVIPHKPGGGHDVYARSISPYLTKHLRQLNPSAKGGDLLIKNEPAAAGRKGYTNIMNARPDGYTIGSLESAVVIDNIMGTADIEYTNFTFLLLAVSTTKMIITNKQGYNSWKDLTAAMKKEPVKVAVGSYGRDNHVAAIILNETMKTNFKPIPLPGTAESLNALLRGDVQAAIVSEDTVKAMVEAKEVKVMLVFSDKCDYPGGISVKEAGFPELADDISSHRFMVAPPKLAPEPQKYLQEAIKRATTDKDFVAWAKGANFPLRNLYGSDAKNTFLKIIKLYDNLAPLLKKVLN